MHLDSLKTIGNRIYDATQNQLIPDATDIYLSKIRKEIKLEKTKKSTNLLHPFYYLGWSDLIGLINKNPNFEIIGDSIGITNRDILINNINIPVFIRNDVAHSRFIDSNDYIPVKSTFEQISIAIPGFNNLCDSQTCEKTQEDHHFGKQLVIITGTPCASEFYSFAGTNIPFHNHEIKPKMMKGSHDLRIIIQNFCGHTYRNCCRFILLYI